MNKIKLLLVDDETQICQLLAPHFLKRGYLVYTACSGMHALDIIKTRSPHIMLIDKRMAEIDGIAILRKVREFNKDLKVIFVSADALDIDTAEQCKYLNVSGYLNKPIAISDLDVLVKQCSLERPEQG